MNVRSATSLQTDTEVLIVGAGPTGLALAAELARRGQMPASPSMEFMQSVLDRRGPTASPARIRDIVWSSRFHVHHRMAESPRKGPVLICGDAAHVHSPVGGQG